MLRPLLISLGAFSLMLLPGCAKKKELNVTDGYVCLSPVRANPSAAYFTVHGGKEDVKLIDVHSSVAIRSEMHSSGHEGDMASMQRLTSVDVPADGDVKFAPGGKHVMLWNVNPGITPGKTMPLTFTFSNGETIEYDAPVMAPGAAAPDGK